MTVTRSYRARSAVSAVTRRVPAPVRVLAQPPAGSGLKPVYGVGGLPLVGSSMDLMVDMVGVCREQYARFGEVSWVNAFGLTGVVVLGPDAIAEVLSNKDKAFANAGWRKLLDPFFERGIMLLDFEEHLHDRRIMQAGFGRPQLEGYLELLNASIARSLSGWSPRRGFRVFDAAKLMTLDVASEVFLGEEPSPEVDRINRAFIDSVAACQSVVRADVPGGAWHRGLKSRAYLERYFRERVAAKRAGGGSDLFSVLCRAVDEDGNRFTDEDIVNHMIFVLLAAHDTSTITFSMMAYFLGKHPEWQERARAESRALGRAAIGYDDLERLSTLDLVMKESLRMCSPVGILVREAVRDTSIRGHHVPAGTIAMLGLYPSMRMEPWWSDPDTFDPERFSEERREDKSHRLAWVPFGAGVHKCIGLYFGGMEVKAAMHQLILSHEWSVPADYEPPLDFGTGPMPADGLPLSLRRTTEVVR
ncbi:MAG TPA: cytochrome P450 [Nocardioidaceae bacterium]|nr:cytochrome P450 [Nocardioidaceae bacterium]